jgi:hypothetical protein
MGTGSDACIACGSGKYSTTVGATSDVCQACSTNSDALEGSNELTDCICNAGYTEGFPRGHRIQTVSAYFRRRPGYAGPSSSLQTTLVLPSEVLSITCQRPHPRP